MRRAAGPVATRGLRIARVCGVYARGEGHCPARVEDGRVRVAPGIAAPRPANPRTFKPADDDALMTEAEVDERVERTRRALGDLDHDAVASILDLADSSRTRTRRRPPP